MLLPELIGVLWLLWQGAATSVDVQAADASRLPVAGVRVELRAAGEMVAL